MLVLDFSFTFGNFHLHSQQFHCILCARLRQPGFTCIYIYKSQVYVYIYKVCIESTRANFDMFTVIVFLSSSYETSASNSMSVFRENKRLGVIMLWK